MLDIPSLFASPAFAQEATAPAADAAPPGGLGSIGMGFLPLLLIFAVFYILLIRPQQKRLDEQARMVKALKRGDRIVTGGGVHGKITKVLDDNENLMVEIADGVQIKVVRNTVTALAAKTEPVIAKSDEPANDAEKKD
ncbi:MAG: preprotein translocase subunit YajC [Bdellovibrionales bacterium]